MFGSFETNKARRLVHQMAKECDGYGVDKSVKEVLRTSEWI